MEVRLCTEAKLRMAFRRVAFPSEISEELMTECNARLYAANEGLHNHEESQIYTVFPFLFPISTASLPKMPQVFSLATE